MTNLYKEDEEYFGEDKEFIFVIGHLSIIGLYILLIIIALWFIL